MSGSVRLITVVAASALIACTAEQEVTTIEISEAPVEEVMDQSARAAAAVAAPTRLEADLEDDESRKPAEVLAFVAVEPGIALFEMEAGGGYYTELFSYLVGNDGSVVMQNPPSFDRFLGDALEQRTGNDRLPNVRISRTNFDALDAEDASVDMVTWFLGPHEVYFIPPGGESLGDPEGSYEEIARILKPGGVFVALDHAAAAGAPSTTGGTLHRVDPQIVKGMAAGVGLALIDESDVLSNPDDMHDMNVFDPMVRRKTDRFILKFAKPE
ncbi:MAG: methyltransferase domain-containing protein [Pseudomonadota bacterium]